MLRYEHDGSGQITALSWNGQPLLADVRFSPLGVPSSRRWPFAVNLADQRRYNSAGQLIESEIAVY